MAKLTKPDKVRCQGEKLSGSFMTLGPREWQRCENPTFYIATENKPREDGLCGSMGLCPECSQVMVNLLGIDYATLDEVVKI